MSVFEKTDQDVRREAASRGILKGKKALVTGGSRGIGRAIALAMAEAGADVAINYQSQNEAADTTCAVARECGIFAQTYRADISHEEEADAMIAKIGQDFGRIDILVNNAGITRDKSFLKMSKMLWDEVLGVNLPVPSTLPTPFCREWSKPAGDAS